MSLAKFHHIAYPANVPKRRQLALLLHLSFEPMATFNGIEVSLGFGAGLRRKPGAPMTCLSIHLLIQKNKSSDDHRPPARVPSPPFKMFTSSPVFPCSPFWWTDCNYKVSRFFAAMSPKSPPVIVNQVQINAAMDKVGRGQGASVLVRSLLGEENAFDEREPRGRRHASCLGRVCVLRFRYSFIQTFQRKISVTEVFAW